MSAFAQPFINLVHFLLLVFITNLFFEFYSYFAVILSILLEKNFL